MPESAAADLDPGVQQRIACPSAVCALVSQFAEQLDSYTTGDYSEAQLRIDFINPMLETLGWDVNNKKGDAEAYRDVVYEDAVRIAGHQKAPDYGFYIGGRAAGSSARKFFLEAKKPSINLRVDTTPAKQLRRYAWTAGLPVSILTNFRQFLVFDTRIKPLDSDKATTAVILSFDSSELPERWHEIASVFARDAITRGSFDKFTEKSRKKRGALPVDEAFLEEIETWREELAHHIADRNPNLSQDDLNFAVQRTIDRIIFLRMCEDRGIEPLGSLNGLRNGDRIYERLAQLYDRADRRYNSGLFHFAPERGRDEQPDTLTLTLDIGDAPLKKILKRLYDSPYEFSVMPPEILGQVYERFLGKVIALKQKRGGGIKVEIEEKPEVRKAGGVYYTPAYIVEYIVRNTVGKLLGDSPLAPGSTRLSSTLRLSSSLSLRAEGRPEGSSPKSAGGSSGRIDSATTTRRTAGDRSASNPPAEPGANGRITPREAAKIRVLDPACGSGSFLIGAYQFLLDWHLEWYLDHDPESHCKGKNPPLRRAMRRNDVPPPSQGGTSVSSVEPGKGVGGARTPPDGNGIEYRLTPSRRKEILTNSIYGVDIDAQAVEVTKLSLLLKVLEGESEATVQNHLDRFHERALPDLGRNIKCGNSLIGPDFYDDEENQKLSDAERKRINAFDWHREFPDVFPSPSGRGVRGEGGTKGKSASPGGFDAVIGNPPYGATFSDTIKEYLFTNFRGIRGQPESYEYFLQMAVHLTKRFGRVGMIVPTNFIESDRAEGLRGLLLSEGAIEVISSFRYNVWQNNAAETLVLIFNRSARAAETLVVHPATPEEFLQDSRARRARQDEWRKLPKQRFLIRADVALMQRIESVEARLGDIVDVSQGIIVYKTRADSARNLYIAEARKGPEWKPLLDTRSRVQRYSLDWGGRWLKYGKWLWCPREDKYFEQPKLIFVRLRNKSLGRKLIATFDNDRFYNRDNFNNIISKDQRYSLKFILGLFNSELLNYWYKSYFDNVNINPAQVRLIPIRTIDFASKSDKKKHDQLVALVDRMLDLHKRLAAAKAPADKERLPREIEQTDQQIDQLVYELYGLTDEEIRIVEEATQ